MKRMIGTMILILTCTMLFAGAGVQFERHHSTGIPTAPQRVEEIFYQVDFEDGLEGWTHFDATLPSSMWHPDDLASLDFIDPPDNTGTVWWMGDTEIGGYIDELYVVLDTDPVMVSAGDHLTFDLAFGSEDPGTGSHTEYNGWDGCNVRISTDNGATWTPISGYPAYNVSSMFAFGYIHGEGPDVPGWGGTSDATLDPNDYEVIPEATDSGWIPADFDLSAYAGQEVMIRFAFASDGAINVNNDENWFGMMVDNIALGSFTNDGVEGNMTYTSVVPVGGDLWHLAEVGDAPSPTHAMVCSDDPPGYNINMYNIFESPSITLPTGGDIRADFMLRGMFNDPDEHPAVDWWGWEISTDGGVNWLYMSNPYDDPNGNNYVYVDAPEIWSSVVESYSLDGYISDFAGMDVKFRIFFQSDDDTPDGEGIMIDDFTIYVDQFLPAPQDLTATLDNFDVELNWESPFGGGGGTGWIHWDSGNNSDGIGTGEAVDIDVAAKFPPEDLTDYVGSQITTVKFFPKEATANYTVQVWSGANGATEILAQPVPNPVIDAWNEITLNSPVEIEFGQAYWIGYEADTPGGYPCGCDEGPSIPGRGSWIRQNDGAWSELPSLNPQLDYNWNIQAYVDAPAGGIIPIPQTRDLLGYNIYRSTESGADDPELIATIDDPDQLTWTDTEPVANMHNYYRLTATYDEGESPFTEEAGVFVPSATAVEYSWDDGSAESVLAPQVGHNYATKFVPFIHPDVGEVVVMQFKLYLESVGTQALILRAWDDDGTDGAPGTQLHQMTIPVSQLSEGWNIFMIDAEDQFVIQDGAFYLGLFGSPPMASEIGLDQSGSGHAWELDDPTAGWHLTESGNYMIRAIVDAGTGTGEPVVPVPALTLTNHPNPFNPVTSVVFNLPQPGSVDLAIYNIRGQRIRRLVHDRMAAGEHTILWNGLDDNGNAVSSGVYFGRLETGSQTLTRRLVLMK